MAEWETLVRMDLIEPIAATMYPHDIRLKKTAVSIGKTKLPCVSLTATNIFFPRASYCFEPDRPILRSVAGNLGLNETVYNGIVAFQGHFVARDINVVSNNKPRLTIHVDILESLPAGMADSEFAPPPAGVHSVRMSGKCQFLYTSDGLFSTYPRFLLDTQTAAKGLHIEGKVEVQTMVGKDGAVIVLRNRPADPKNCGRRLSMQSNNGSTVPFQFWVDQPRYREMWRSLFSFTST